MAAAICGDRKIQIRRSRGVVRVLVAAGILVNQVVLPGAAEGAENVWCVALEYLHLSGKFPAATHPTTSSFPDNSHIQRIYSTFQVSEVHNRGRDTSLPCPYGNRRAIGVYFINVESAVSDGVKPLHVKALFIQHSVKQQSFYFSLLKLRQKVSWPHISINSRIPIWIYRKQFRPRL